MPPPELSGPSSDRCIGPAHHGSSSTAPGAPLHPRLEELPNPAHPRRSPAECASRDACVDDDVKSRCEAVDELASRNSSSHRGSNRSSAPTARARSQVCTNTSRVKFGIIERASRRVAELLCNSGMSTTLSNRRRPGSNAFPSWPLGQLPPDLRIIARAVGLEPRRSNPGQAGLNTSH
jgi:hypothetical protein